MLHGSAWLVGLRWAIRLTGLISTVLLARLLSPDDFGVVAIAMIVVGLFEMFSATGQELAIIRHEAPTSEHYDTAWTISAGIGLGIAILLFLLAPLSNYYFHDPRSVAVIRCLALRPLLNGIENIGMVDFQRSLRFDKVFNYNFYSKLISFLVTVALAFFLRSYWALVAGILTGQISKTVLSYTLHPFRPKISFEKYADLWSFSIWSFLRAIGTYGITQIDNIAVGGITGATSMGRYTVAKDVASSPVDELNEPVSAVLFPVMARYQSKPAELRQLYLRTLGWAAVIGASASIGVTLVARDVVAIILGAKWTPIVPMMSWLAVTAGVGALTNSSFTVLDVTGIPRIGARMQWARVGLLILALFPIAYLTHDLVQVAEARLAMTVLFVPSLLIVAGRRVNVTVNDYVKVVWRPIAAGMTMAFVVLFLNRAIAMNGEFRLPVDVVVGAISFSAALLGFWQLNGRPISPESDLINLLKSGKSKLLA